MSWIGDAINGAGTLLDFIGQGKNIDKQIWAQQQENRKNREYNFMLAQQQNKWSVEQWERENEYNSPKNQMARLKEGGIHPGLAYTNGVHNISASSPSMTAGAPSTPADMSVLGQKPTLGQAMQMALANEMTRAQIDNIKADTHGKDILNDSNKLDVETKRTLSTLMGSASDWLEDSNVMHNQLVRSKLSEFAKVQQEFENARDANPGISADSAMKKIEKLFKQDEVEAIVKDLKNKANISEQDAKFALESYTQRLLGFEAEQDLHIYEAKLRGVLNDDDNFQSFLAGCLRFIRLLRDTIF